MKRTLNACLASGTLLASATAAGLVVGCSGHPNPFPGQGITNSYRDYIPMTASKVAESVGTASYTAESQGTAYIVDLSRFDQTTKTTAVPHVMATVLLLKGQSVNVDGSAGTITTGPINNVTATSFKNTNLKPDATYQIFFDNKKQWHM